MLDEVLGEDEVEILVRDAVADIHHGVDAVVRLIVDVDPTAQELRPASDVQLSFAHASGGRLFQ